MDQSKIAKLSTDIKNAIDWENNQPADISVALQNVLAFVITIGVEPENQDEVIDLAMKAISFKVKKATELKTALDDAGDDPMKRTIVKLKSMLQYD